MRSAAHPAEDFQRQSGSRYRQQEHPERIKTEGSEELPIQGGMGGAGHAAARAVPAGKLVKRAARQPWQAARTHFPEKKCRDC
jgi:hypothetical protein